MVRKDTKFIVATAVASFGIGMAQSAKATPTIIYTPDTFSRPASMPSNAGGTIAISSGPINADAGGGIDAGGKVNGTDFNILAANFNTGGDTWDQGDFSYDGQVNGANFNILAANFNTGTLDIGSGSAGTTVSGGTLLDVNIVPPAPALTISNNPQELFTTTNVPSLDPVSLIISNNTAISVPEPATLAVFACGAIGLLARRRRNIQ